MIRQGTPVSENGRRGEVIRTYRSCGVSVAVVRWSDGTRSERPAHVLREVAPDAGLFACEETAR